MNLIAKHYRLIFIACILLLTLIATWFLLPVITFDDASPFDDYLSRTLLIFVIALLSASIIMHKKLVRKNMSEQELVKQESGRAEKLKIKQEKRLLKQKTNEIFFQLINTLGTWLFTKRTYLKLPWYLAIGAPGNGKTSALLHTSDDYLKLELNSDISNQPCKCWVNHRRVILDVTSTKKSINADFGIVLNTPFWLGLFKYIRWHRLRRPLNGVIVTLNLHELLLQTERSLLNYQQGLQQTLRQIYQQFRRKLPVYFVITKCDLVSGFQDFFADLNKEDTEQPWGIIFPSNRLLNQKESVEYFDHEYDQLISCLNTRLIWRLEKEKDPYKREVITYFPQQMQIFKSVLKTLLNNLEQQQIQGLYFTSSMQNEQPYDFLMSSLTNRFKLYDVLTQHHHKQEKQFFIKNIFKEITLCETDWANNNLYKKPIRLFTKRTHWITAAIILIFGLVGLSASYARNIDNLNLIQNSLPEYEQAIKQLSPSNMNLSETLPILNAIKRIDDIYADAPSKWLLYFQIYQPSKISNATKAAVRHALNIVYMPRIAHHLEQLINQNNTELTYFALKGYLAFNHSSGTKTEWIKSPIAYDLAHNLNISTETQTQLNEYLNEALQHPVNKISANPIVIEQAQKKLQPLSPYEFSYYELKALSEQSSGGLNIRSKIGNASKFFVFIKNEEIIPALYTKTGLNNLFKEKSDALIERTASSYKILGLSENINLAELTDRIAPELWARYNNDYADAWQTRLNHIHIAPFNNLSHAIDNLTLLDSAKSPLLKILKLIYQNTGTVFDKNLNIRKPFLALNNITQTAFTADSRYKLITKNITAVKNYLIALNNSPDSAQAQFIAARAYLQGVNNPIRQLKNLAQQMPTPINQWLNEIADNSAGVLLSGAHRVVNNAWRTNVYPNYQTKLQGKFPFNKQNEVAISLNDFGDFFGHEETYSQFFQTYLKPFINTTHSPWSLVSVGNHTLGLSDNTVKQLETATTIGNTFFINGNKLPTIQFTIQPRLLDPQISSVSVQLATQNLTYRHGPQQTFSWHWPDSSDTQQASVSYSDFKGQNNSQTFDGTWAWFRLLSNSQITYSGKPGHYVWTVNLNHEQASFDLFAANNMPMFNLEMLNNFNLAESI